MAKKYCSSCGNPIPDGQGSNCSMCYGDVNYGTDGFYTDWLLERSADEENRRREELQQNQEEEQHD